MSSLKASCSWVSRRHTGSIPTPRQGHSVTLLGDKIFVFGGSRWNDEEGVTEYYRSLYILSPQNEDLVWSEVEQKGELPLARESHVVVAIDDSLLLIGGKNEEDADQCLPGIRKFHVQTCSWSAVSTSGCAPSAVGFSASLVRREIYCFGGFEAGSANNDIFMLYIDTNSWTKIKPSGLLPAPRCDHAAAVVGDRVFVFGGCGGESLFFNDVVVFDTNTLSWRHPRVHGRPPAARGSASFVAHRDKDIYLFGGTSEREDGSVTLFNDVVKLSLVEREAAPHEAAAAADASGAAGGSASAAAAAAEGRLYHKLRWKRPIHVGRTIGPLYGHAAAIAKSHMYIVGGMNADGETNRVQTLRLLNPSQRVPILEELMQQYESTQPLVSPPNLIFDLAVPPFQKPAILEPALPSSAAASRLTGELSALKLRAKESKKLARENVEDAFDALIDLMEKFEEQKLSFVNEKEIFAREKAAYKQQYQDQQQELSLLIQRHKEQMELWIKEQTEMYVAQQKRAEDERQQILRQHHEVAQEKSQLEQSKLSMMHLIQGMQPP